MDPAIISLDTAEAAPDPDVPDGFLLERTNIAHSDPVYAVWGLRS